MSNIRMLNKQEEVDSEVEVSWADQQQINSFSKLNSKIDDLEEQHAKIKQEKEYLDDVGLELELADEDELVRHKIGDAFVHIPVSEAVERVEKESTKLGLELKDIESQINNTQDQMNELKKSLYAKFGNAINLEKD